MIFAESFGEYLGTLFIVFLVMMFVAAKLFRTVDDDGKAGKENRQGRVLRRASSGCSRSDLRGIAQPRPFWKGIDVDMLYVVFWYVKVIGISIGVLCLIWRLSLRLGTYLWIMFQWKVLGIKPFSSDRRVNPCYRVRLMCFGIR